MPEMWTKSLQRLVRREGGQSMVEYAALIGLISLGVVALLSLMGVGGQIFDQITAGLRLVPGVSQQ